MTLVVCASGSENFNARRTLHQIKMIVFGKSDSQIDNTQDIAVGIVHYRRLFTKFNSRCL